jgi:hypothetical protein
LSVGRGAPGQGMAGRKGSKTEQQGRADKAQQHGQIFDGENEQ